MSEAEVETPTEGAESPQEPAEPPAEGTTDLEPGAAPEPAGEPADGSEPPDAGEPPEGAPGPRDERELRAVAEKVRKEGERHENRLIEILGADFGALANCPLCAHGAAGYIGLWPLPEDAIPVLRAMLGMPDLSNLEADPELALCQTCKGKGQTRTPSDVPGFETRTCPTCKGVGYTGGVPIPPNGPPPPGEPVAVVAGAAELPGDSDPEVQHLRDRGFTVIPPTRFAGDA